MLVGKVDGAGGFYDHTIALQGIGKSAESVVSMLQVPGEVELWRTDLQAGSSLPRGATARLRGSTAGPSNPR